MTILILGGATEANALAHALAGRDVISSLAGRAGVPDLPGRVRVGGFGGASGLAQFLEAENISAVVDATHPFAARITAHAAEACAATGIPRLLLVRPEWRKEAGDHWVEAAGMDEAARLLPGLGRRAFLTVGMQEVAAFTALPLFKLVRLITAQDIPGCTVIAGRGPFTEEAEAALMVEYGIDVVVTKQSGGAATYGKIAAARQRGIPVLMIRRPAVPEGPRVESVGQAVDWLLGRAQDVAAGGVVEL
jgi:precorrin-6A/cobalt-precorrin-6A reductase